MKKPIKCLNMIIGYDSIEVIERCFESVKDFVDSWCICYNGGVEDHRLILESSIEKYLGNKPGKLYERPWVNDYAFSRNEALQLAKHHGTHAFIIDSDNKLGPTNNFVFDPNIDAYRFMIETEDGTIFPRLCLVKLDLDWEWKYNLHEKLFCNQSYVINDSNLSILAIDDGVRSQSVNKRKKDIEILIKGYKETEDPHYLFYLAQTYRNDGQYTQAYKMYKSCLVKDDEPERIYYCQLQIARMREELAHPDELVVNEYIKAHSLNPYRAEALGYLAQFWEKKKIWWAMAWAANEICGLSMPTTTCLFLETFWYNYLALDKFAMGSINNGKLEDGILAYKILLESEKTPESEKARIGNNLTIALRKQEANKNVSKL